MTHYVGILDGQGDVWGVRVPDLPGVYGGGATPEAAIRDATSAAREWVTSVTAKGANIPRASALTDILAEVSVGEALVMIPVPTKHD